MKKILVGLSGHGYWGEELIGPLAVFDAAVNQGVVPAIRLLQDALHVSIDGKVGPATIEAARHSGKAELIRFMTNRGFTYSHMLNFERFGHGWLSRLFRIYEATLPSFSQSI